MIQLGEREGGKILPQNPVLGQVLAAEAKIQSD